MYEIDLNLPKQIVADVLSNHEIHSVAFVGCGASMSDLYPAKYFLANNTDKLNVQIFTANEFNYDTPSWVNEHTFVITCSLGGSTPETVEANKTAKKHNCPVVSLTNKAGSALTVDADHVIVSRLPRQLRCQVREARLCHCSCSRDPSADRGL